MPGSKVRSPSYPFLSLEEALERARVLYEKEHRNPVHPEMAVTYWGYGPATSKGRLTRKCLELYGFLEGDGNGAVRLTERAVRLLLDGKGSLQLLQEAARLPPIHARLWERYGATPPFPRELGLALVLDHSFNDRSAQHVAQNYLKTLDFAGLRGGRTEEERPHPAPPPPPQPAIAFEMRPNIPPAHAQVAPVTFPLLDGNSVEFRIQRRIRPEEAEEVRALFEIWLPKIVLPG